MCAFAWNGRRRLVAVRLFRRSYAQAGMFTRVPLPPPTAVRPPHRTENEACCVWRNAAVKQPSVRWLPFKTKRFIAAVKKRCGSNRSCALALRLRPAWQRPACTRFHARAGNWRFCVLRGSDRLVAQWRH